MYEMHKNAHKYNRTPKLPLFPDSTNIRDGEDRQRKVGWKEKRCKQKRKWDRKGKDVSN